MVLTNHRDSSDFNNLKKAIVLRMKNITKILILVFVPCVIWAQKDIAAKADLLFANRSYVQAAKLYAALPPSQKTLQNLGDCYFYNSQMDSASKTYAQLFNSKTDSIQPEFQYRYAQALMGINDYKKADIYMTKYLGRPVETQKFIENTTRSTPFLYDLKKVSKDKNAGDFGISYWGDKVVFASQKKSEEQKYQWNDKPYLDLYEATVSKDGELQNIKPFPKEINTKKHESSATFSSDGKIMYFDRNNDKRIQIGNEKYSSIKIFRAEWDGQNWTNITPTSFSGDSFSTKHPMLSKNGKRLYFSSDRPGSFGSFDLYYVDILDNGTYSEPINLGNVINTERREQFPFVDQGDFLYFSSDGHQGLGGLDIFVSKLHNENYIKPINLGPTANSGMDDFAFTVNKMTDTGYLSSNRDGADEIYSFGRKDNPNRPGVEGIVRDIHTKTVLPGTTVSIFDEENRLAGQLIVDEKGDYLFNTEPNKKYRLSAEKDFYVPYNETFTTNESGKAEFIIELEIETYDDAEEIVVTKNDGHVYIELENIYFEFDKHYITPEAAKTLNVLVDLLKKYPKMEIELGAHTDSKASPTYNLNLSHLRAKSAMDYIISKGINSKRLRSKGYGESKPLVNCGNNCTEVEDAINRRCEFIILK